MRALVPRFFARVFAVGGNYDNGLSAGAVARNANNSSSNANANYGGRLLVRALPSVRTHSPHRLVKILPSGQGLVGSFSNGLEANKEGLYA